MSKKSLIDRVAEKLFSNKITRFILKVFEITVFSVIIAQLIMLIIHIIQKPELISYPF